MSCHYAITVYSWASCDHRYPWAPFHFLFLNEKTSLLVRFSVWEWDYQMKSFQAIITAHGDPKLHYPFFFRMEEEQLWLPSLTEWILTVGKPVSSGTKNEEKIQTKAKEQRINKKKVTTFLLNRSETPCFFYYVFYNRKQSPRPHKMATAADSITNKQKKKKRIQRPQRGDCVVPGWNPVASRGALPSAGMARSGGLHFLALSYRKENIYTKNASTGSRTRSYRLEGDNVNRYTINAEFFICHHIPSIKWAAATFVEHCRAAKESHLIAFLV